MSHTTYEHNRCVVSISIFSHFPFYFFFNTSSVECYDKITKFTNCIKMKFAWINSRTSLLFHSHGTMPISALATRNIHKHLRHSSLFSLTCILHKNLIMRCPFDFDTFSAVSRKSFRMKQIIYQLFTWGVVCQQPEIRIELWV